MALTPSGDWWCLWLNCFAVFLCVFSRWTTASCHSDYVRRWKCPHVAQSPTVQLSRINPTVACWLLISASAPPIIFPPLKHTGSLYFTNCWFGWITDLRVDHAEHLASSSGEADLLLLLSIGPAMAVDLFVLSGVETVIWYKYHNLGLCWYWITSLMVADRGHRSLIYKMKL